MHRVSIPDTAIEVRHELDEGLIQVTPNGAGDVDAEVIQRAANDLPFPRIQGSLERAGEAAHPVDVSEKLFVGHADQR